MSDPELPFFPVLNPVLGGQIRTLLRALVLLLTSGGVVLFKLPPETAASILAGLTLAEVVVGYLTHGTKLQSVQVAPAPPPEPPVQVWPVQPPLVAPEPPFVQMESWSVNPPSVNTNLYAPTFSTTPPPPMPPMPPMPQVEPTVVHARPLTIDEQLAYALHNSDAGLDH